MNYKEIASAIRIIKKMTSLIHDNEEEYDSELEAVKIESLIYYNGGKKLEKLELKQAKKISKKHIREEKAKKRKEKENSDSELKLFKSSKKRKESSDIQIVQIDEKINFCIDCGIKRKLYWKFCAGCGCKLR